MPDAGQIRITVEDLATEKLAKLRHELTRWQVNLARTRTQIIAEARPDAADRLTHIQIQEDVIADVLGELVR